MNISKTVIFFCLPFGETDVDIPSREQYRIYGIAPSEAGLRFFLSIYKILLFEIFA